MQSLHVAIQRCLTAALACVCVAIIGASARAQDWPTKPVHFVVPFVPGGATDILGRIYSDRLAARLGQPVIIDNRPGAGGNVGAAFVAKSPPDGYTLFIASSPGFTNAVALSKDAGFDPVGEFVAVTLLATQSQMLILNTSLAPNTLAEFVAFAKAQPGKLSYGTPGIGTPHHLAMELFKLTAGIDIVHVPYRGGAPMLQDALAGQVPIMFASYVIAGPHLKAGKLKAIASTSTRRVPQAPEVVPIAEQGYPGFDVESWFGLVAPVGTPDAAITRLTREMQALQALDEIKERLLQVGFEPPPVLSTPEMAERLKRDVVKWSKVVTDANIKPE